MEKILVIGASGFVGRHVAVALLSEGYAVRCLARDPARIQNLASAGCETVKGDISDLTSMQNAVKDVQAAYICIHTLSAQPGNPGRGFMEIEMNGLQNIVTACRMNGVPRLIYITFLGISPDGASEWIRGRWQAEQLLLKSSLNVTVIRPGQIVGVGGQGFDMMMSQAKLPTALNLFLSGKTKLQNIALDDLIYYLVGVLKDPRTYGQCYDVGCDDILTNNQMIDVAAEVLGRPHPRIKIDVPWWLLRALAPLIERSGKFPKGSVKGILGSGTTDLVGDPRPIRAILPRQPLPYRQAVERALGVEGPAKATPAEK